MLDTISEAIADPNTLANPPYAEAVFARIRSETPLRWMSPQRTRPFWFLSRHADIIEVERQPQLFINAPRTELLTLAEEEQTRVATGGGSHHSRTLLHMDGAEHRAYRAITQGWFLPANLRKLEDRMAALAQEYVDRMVAKGDRCEFVNDIAVWYPLRVIMTIMGIPPEEEPEILRLTQGLVARKDASVEGVNHSEDGALSAAREIFAYFAAIHEDRQRQPRDELASVIAQATIDGKPIGHVEALSYYLLIATAGHDTTSATIAGGLLALIQNPDELAKLRRDPALFATLADEMVRWVTPVKHFFRTATQDYVLRGQQIKAGDSLMLSFVAANRDEEVFEHPFSFKVDRTPNPHLGFGHGAHSCVGLHLAKMEIRALFREILQRFEHIELDGEPSWLAVTLSGGLKQLPIRYELR